MGVYPFYSYSYSCNPFTEADRIMKSMGITTTRTDSKEPFKEVINVAGFDKGDIKLDYNDEDEILVVTAKRDKNEKSLELYIDSSKYDVEKVNAKYELGLLTIEVPRYEKKTINISIN